VYTRLYLQKGAKNVLLEAQIGPILADRVDEALKTKRRGAVDIASASGSRRPGFESRQGIRFLGKQSSAVDLICMHCLCVEKEKK
jgi:hypothetical protein